MLNEEKLRLMTDLAMFEKKHGTGVKIAASYFKGDYISRKLIRGFLCYTLCSLMLLAVWILFNLDLFISTRVMDSLVGMLWKAAALYGGGLLFYAALIVTIYGQRYETWSGMSRIYIVKLKHLDKRYEYQRRSRELAREGRRV